MSAGRWAFAAEDGLTAAEVARRVAAGGANDVPVRASRTVGQIVRANVLTRVNAIFAVLLAIILVTGSPVDAAFGGFIIANSVIGMVQELRAKQTLDRLAIVGRARPTVRRDGRATEIDSTEVVLDDVIELGPGDQVIVDGVVLDAAGVEVDESLLTGESDLVVKDPGDEVLSGSFVVAGTGAYRAAKVGHAAYAARLAQEASKFTLARSELNTGINKILKFITWLLVPAGALTVWNQLSGQQPLSRALTGMVGALVPMVPEGLVLMVAIAFAVGVIRLGRRQCLVQELPAIEGLAIPGLIGLEKLSYPFLPRHVTTVSWFTIGLPAFVLSLAPNNERARTGFVSRVMRSAVPAGVVVAATTFVSYLLVYPGAAAPQPGLMRAATAALITLIATSLWVVAIVARPYTWWKVVLVATMVALSTLMFVLPLTRTLFALDPTDRSFTLTGFACAAAGIALVELAWWLDSRFRPAGAG